MRQFINLFEVGLTIRGEQQSPDESSPARMLCRVMTSAFKSHPYLHRYVDLYLVIAGPQKVEIAYIMTERFRKQGYAGTVFDLLMKAADEFNVTLKLQAHFAKEDDGRKTKVLSQEGLENFYARRGFVMVDPRDRVMERKPQMKVRAVAENRDR